MPRQTKDATLSPSQPTKRGRRQNSVSEGLSFLWRTTLNLEVIGVLWYRCRTRNSEIGQHPAAPNTYCNRDTDWWQCIKSHLLCVRHRNISVYLYWAKHAATYKRWPNIYDTLQWIQLNEHSLIGLPYEFIHIFRKVRTTPFIFFGTPFLKKI